MKDKDTKKRFLEHLRKVPIIQVACEKTNISRATIYRWRDKEKKFRKELEEALAEGEALVNDMGESQLISLIRDKNYQAISFWLRHRHQKFRDRVEVSGSIQTDHGKLSKEDAKLIRKALQLASHNEKPAETTS